MTRSEWDVIGNWLAYRYAQFLAVLAGLLLGWKLLA